MTSLKPPMPLSLLLEDLGLPALALGVARVHAEEVADEERRLLAAGAGADFDDRVLVGRAGRGEQQHLEARPRARPARLELLRLLLGHRPQLGVFFVCATGRGRLPDRRHSGMARGLGDLRNRACSRDSVCSAAGRAATIRVGELALIASNLSMIPLQYFGRDHGGTPVGGEPSVVAHREAFALNHMAFTPVTRKRFVS